VALMLDVSAPTAGGAKVARLGRAQPARVRGSRKRAGRMWRV